MNRFHSKFHRKNHHTNTDSNNPDAGHDPIASQDAPFQGDFFLNGSLSASQGITIPSLKLPTLTDFGGFIRLQAGATNFVSSTQTQLSSIIFLTTQSASAVNSGTIGTPFVASRTVSSGFTVSSTSVNDRSMIGWFMIQKQ
jgi:hypothetical protein